MAPSKIRKAIGAVKDQTSISLARVGSSPSLSDLDVAIVKATRHEEYPPEERHIREILSLTSYSHAHVAACVSRIARRLSKTRNWVVALKTLMLVQRLLGEGDAAYEQEIFFATRRGTRLLNMSDFRDTSGKSNAWDYSAFVRTYSLYLDEKIEFRMQGRRGKRSGFGCHDEDGHRGGGDDAAAAASNSLAVTAPPVREMKMEKLFSRVHHLMQLVDRFLACRPTGAAKDNRMVAMAIYPIVNESFQLYYHIMEIMAFFLDRFQQLNVPDSVKVHNFFNRLSKQHEELDDMYTWCKAVGISRSSEFPQVEKIPRNRLDVLDAIIQRKSHNQSASGAEPEPEPEPDIAAEAVLEVAEEGEVDMNEIKALPPAEGFEVETEHDEDEIESKEVERNQPEGDLLNLSQDEPTFEEEGNKLALALFDGGSGMAASSSGAMSTPWEAFKAGNWETALVETASHLSNQKVSLAGGFDTLMLNGMYQHGMLNQAAASSGVMTTGSASSVALGSAGRPAVLALPAPPAGAAGGSVAGVNADPFAASLAVAPPAYVQISDMEKKQRLLAQEQVMWQQYARDGMQGQVGLAKIQQQQQQNTF